MRAAIQSQVAGIDRHLPDGGKEYEITVFCRHKTNPAYDVLLNSSNDLRAVIARLKAMDRATVIERVSDDIDLVSTE